MKRGGKFLIATAMVAVTACGMEQGKLQIRSMPTAIAQGARPVPLRIAEARGQLALGNVALALEAFRKASREDPNSIDALAGLASCYDLMGRYDLSQRYYETALALAPADPALLGAFAASLQRQGRNEEAQAVRLEIAARAASAASASAKAAPQLALRAPAASSEPQLAGTAQTPLAVPQSLTAPVVVAGPAMAPPPTYAPIPRPALASAPVAVAGTAAPERLAVSLPAQPKAELLAEAPEPAPAVARMPDVAPVPKPAAVGRSVTVKLPTARPVEAVAAAPAPAAATDLPPLKPYSRPVPQPALAMDRGPRLERLSLGEIGLITASGPVWRTTAVAQTARTTRLRFVPVRQASAQPPRVRLLNAARVDQLAARTRSWLVARGWRGLAIGNASARRSRSLIVYPAHQRWLAQKLSAQFGFAVAPRASARQVTVLLGSDAARHPALRPRRA